MNKNEKQNCYGSCKKCKCIIVTNEWNLTEDGYITRCLKCGSDVKLLPKNLVKDQELLRIAENTLKKMYGE